jgi:LPS O-antigen subunit length determinant protein (WzzB/FepE family)
MILGTLALAVIWFYVKKLFTKDDSLSQSPAELLENELLRRREKERETAQAFERLKDADKRRLNSVAEALKEMWAASNNS